MADTQIFDSKTVDGYADFWANNPFGQLWKTITGQNSAEKQNSQNLAFQQQQFDYQKELNQTIMNREDTAAQRSVADMRAAGLSPLAQFSNTAGAGGEMTAPQAPRSAVDYAQFGQNNINAMNNIASNAVSASRAITNSISDFLNAHSNRINANSGAISASAEAQKVFADIEHMNTQDFQTLIKNRAFDEILKNPEQRSLFVNSLLEDLKKPELENRAITEQNNVRRADVELKKATTAQINQQIDELNRTFFARIQGLNLDNSIKSAILENKKLDNAWYYKLKGADLDHLEAVNREIEAEIKHIESQTKLADLDIASQTTFKRLKDFANGIREIINGTRVRRSYSSGASINTPVGGASFYSGSR